MGELLKAFMECVGPQRKKVMACGGFIQKTQIIKADDITVSNYALQLIKYWIYSPELMPLSPRMGQLHMIQ